jgi:hypothetical protein
MEEEREKKELLQSMYKVLLAWQLDEECCITEYKASVGAMEDIKQVFQLT